ncbi:MAG: DUF4294 domain-containing protein [Bacteroidota bacterium]|jgi:hypothetical protein
MKALIVSIVLSLGCCKMAFCQSEILGEEKTTPIQLEQKRFRAKIEGADTIALAQLPTCYIIEKHKFKNSRDEKRYWRLVRNVKKVLPYARLAGNKYKQLNEQLVNKTEGEKKFLMKKVEREIKRDFSKDIKNMTYTQGTILLKLIDRETSITAYDLVKELRGSFSAMFWQSVSLMFDNNLKAEYDPVGDEQEIEGIITLLDKGLL